MHMFFWRLWARCGIIQLDIAKLLACSGGFDITLLIELETHDLGYS